MRTMLIRLYFELEKELSVSYELESEHIVDFLNKIPAEMVERAKSAPDTVARIREADIFNKMQQRVSPLLEECKKQLDTTLLTPSDRSMRRFVMRVLENFLGDELAQAKKIRDEMRLRKILQSFV